MIHRALHITQAAVQIGLTWALLLFPQAPANSQDAPPTFKAGVALVPITAVVRDSDGRLVRDLTRADFEVLEDKRPRPIVEFRATDSGRVSLALLFDTSSSMRDAHHRQGRAIVDALLSAIDPASDELALFTFDQRLRQETPFTGDADVIRAAVSKTVAWGQTSLYDAVGDTAKQLADRPSPRQAVVVVTDGLDTSSSRRAAEVSQAASSVDVPVYVVTVAQRRGWFRSGTPDLAELARATGGEHFPAATPDQVADAIGTLLAELRQQYFLAIESADTRGWHELDVRVKKRGLKVRARSGYFAETR